MKEEGEGEGGAKGVSARRGQISVGVAMGGRTGRERDFRRTFGDVFSVMCKVMPSSVFPQRTQCHCQSLWGSANMVCERL